MKFSETFGKVILTGEHAVLYKKPAIAIPFNKIKTITKIKSNNNYYFFINGKRFLLKQVIDEFMGYKLLIEYFIKKFLITKPFSVNVKTNVPYENGLGHSASIAVSISKALIKYYRINYSDDLVMELSSISESYYHGNPSGIDQMVLIKNTNIIYQNKKIVNYLPKLKGAYLLICNTQIESKTLETVNHIKNNERYFNNLINEIGEVTNQIIYYWNKYDLKTIGILINRNQQLLQELDLSNQVINNLVINLNSKGSLGTKLTGKGRGGAVIALFDQKKKAMKTLKAIKKEGYLKSWIQKL